MRFSLNRYYFLFRCLAEAGGGGGEGPGEPAGPEEASSTAPTPDLPPKPHPSDLPPKQPPSLQISIRMPLQNVMASGLAIISTVRYEFIVCSSFYNLFFSSQFILIQQSSQQR